MHKMDLCPYKQYDQDSGHQAGDIFDPLQIAITNVSTNLMIAKSGAGGLRDHTDILIYLVTHPDCFSLHRAG
jgi:hypothetical protein